MIKPRIKLLLTGVTGYIGKRLLPYLVDLGYYVVCCVRDKDRFRPLRSLSQYVDIIEVDFLEPKTLKFIPKDIEAAYYLIHSMSSKGNYYEMEAKCAINFRGALAGTSVKHVIYLGGIVNESVLSKHLKSRKNVELELGKGKYHFTVLRAGIIIGSGSASFEIIRDLVEKLPIMIAPKWLRTKCQSIGITDVLHFLSGALFREEIYNRNYDIGGPDILTYEEMLLGFSKVRKLKRRIIIVPVMTPRLSSYILYFLTSTSYLLAQSLVNSMKVEVVCRNDDLNHILKIVPISYEESLRRAFLKIESNEIVSSWKDAYVSSGFEAEISDFIQVPSYGCFIDCRIKMIENVESTIDKIWRIGGSTGWYYGNWMWRFRGFLDKLFGGVGVRRGRTNEDKIEAGDALDFWRVLYANRNEGRLLLYAEMKLPGEAWLEFRREGKELVQTATFRPLGLLGRLYWYSVLPFHGFIFKGLIDELTKK